MKLSSVLFELFESQKILFETEQAQEVSKLQSDAKVELKNINNRADLQELLSSEFKLLEYEKNIVKLETVANTSISNALKDYDLLAESINKVKDTQSYKENLSSVPYNRRDSEGLPKDSTRAFLDNHIARLLKRRIEPSLQLQGESEEVLSQRRANMILAKELYKDLQRKALFDEKDRTYLIVPKDDKELAKGNGAKFDEEKKMWFTMSNNPRKDNLFSCFDKCDSEGNSLSVKNKDKNSQSHRMK